MINYNQIYIPHWLDSMDSSATSYVASHLFTFHTG